mmetsp:Transcript_41700/g.67652  ORF Transcript_41700/g.67652 Transcript_41700/m.67652 type:complete len:171 (-) Transcript_41700:484-996(-)|eukprot:CAMPEP_0184645324 /NCGR_PEP_ID=MMETSP0308-20130426/1807_1 /TAXON_ID=38269 /ORGANISM="Gloeochaete witrockiana, Strain SAG 46.84" /LENGTH=170 /DNA_ID=CAMNT_0027074235 /DNA_START=105 /DNA_END=617 /DNA_ORIENTATION=+
MELNFSEYAQALEMESATRERIKDRVKEIELSVRKGQAEIDKLYLSPDSSLFVSNVKALISPIRNEYSLLADIVPSEQYYRFSGHWKDVTHTVVFLISYLFFIEHGTLVTHAELSNLLGLSLLPQSRFHLDLQDFLCGLTFLSNEMPRSAINSVTKGSYSQISREGFSSY